MKTQRVTSSNFDLAGQPINRVLKQNLLYRIIPVGNFGGGPSLPLLIELWGRHTFARLYYAIKIKLEKPAACLDHMMHTAMHYAQRSPSSKKP